MHESPTYWEGVYVLSVTSDFLCFHGCLPHPSPFAWLWVKPLRLGRPFLRGPGGTSGTRMGLVLTRGA